MGRAACAVARQRGSTQRKASGGADAGAACIEKARTGEDVWGQFCSGKRRDELLTGTAFNTLREAQALIKDSCRHRNRTRPHSSLGYRPPAPEIVQSAFYA
jgi:transposase InsO family protein